MTAGRGPCGAPSRAGCCGGVRPAGDQHCWEQRQEVRRCRWGWSPVAGRGRGCRRRRPHRPEMVPRGVQDARVVGRVVGKMPTLLALHVYQCHVFPEHHGGSPAHQAVGKAGQVGAAADAAERPVIIRAQDAGRRSLEGFTSPPELCECQCLAAGSLPQRTDPSFFQPLEVGDWQDGGRHMECAKQPYLPNKLLLKAHLGRKMAPDGLLFSKALYKLLHHGIASVLLQVIHGRQSREPVRAGADPRRRLPRGDTGTACCGCSPRGNSDAAGVGRCWCRWD